MNKHVGPIAIDLGASAVKLLQLGHGSDRPTVQAVAWQPMPAAASAGERDNGVREAIAAALRSAPFKGSQVVLAVHPQYFQIKSVRLPQMPAEDQAGAVSFEAQERFGFGEEGGEFRYLPAGEVRQGTDIKDELIVFGVRKGLIASMLSQFESLRLTPSAIDVAPCAMARAFTRFLRREEDVAAVNVFVDVGAAWTSVVVTRGADVVFVKTIDIGGKRFDEAVAKALDSSPEQANRIRRTVIQASARRRASESPEPQSVPTSVREQVADALRPVIAGLAREIQLCLRYYAVTFRGAKSDSITLVGGEAHEPMLSLVMGEVLSLPVLVGDPLRGMGLSDQAERVGAWSFRPAWSVAAGLALRGSPWIRPLRRIQEPALAAAKP